MKRWYEIFGIIAGLAITFLVINYIHFQKITVYVIFYSCVLDAIIASALFLPAYWLFRKTRGTLIPTEIALAVAVANLGILFYSVVGPTVIDRSLSLYIVEKLHNRGGRISEAAMKEIFIKEYMPEYRLIDVRLTEQVRSGTATIKNGCIELTPRGEFIATISSAYRKFLLPKERVLMGEVTNQLTDPFKNTKPLVDVTCPTFVPN